MRLITVSFDPETGAFPERPLQDIEGEVVNVVEHFFHHLDQPHLLLVVHVRPPLDDRRRTRRGRESPRATLGPGEAELYDRLRAWRNGRAQTEGVPPYVLFTNRHLAEIARRRPADKSALREIDGVGEAKAGRYGREILEVLADARRTPASLPGGASRGGHGDA